MLIEYSKKNPRNLFLLDAGGAVLSAFSLGVLLVRYEDFFGMPKLTLYGLAIAAVCFAIYSFISYVVFPSTWRTLLRIIAWVNLTYCLVTISCMVIHSEVLSIFGYLYFIIEIIILIVLARLELNVARVN